MTVYYVQPVSNRAAKKLVKNLLSANARANFDSSVITVLNLRDWQSEYLKITVPDNKADKFDAFLAIYRRANPLNLVYVSTDKTEFSAVTGLRVTNTKPVETMPLFSRVLMGGGTMAGFFLPIVANLLTKGDAGIGFTEGATIGYASGLIIGAIGDGITRNVVRRTHSVRQASIAGLN